MRYLLPYIAFLLLLNPCTLKASLYSHTMAQQLLNKTIHRLEQEHHLKIGLYVLDTNNQHTIAYQAHDIFPLQSTFKVIAVAALLADKAQHIHKKVWVDATDIVPGHPISGQYINRYVSLQTLAQGAISYSDNSAINLIIKALGGLPAVNTFAKKLGNSSFSLKHDEPYLNSNPTQNIDGATPYDMAISINKILLGNVLSTAHKTLLLEWMKNNTTGDKRIRAGVPLGWTVADKTGSGAYGIANDIGLIWSPACKPVVLSIFTVSTQETAKPNDAIIARLTQMIINHLASQHECYDATRLH